jgi:hypothetical protein
MTDQQICDTWLQLNQPYAANNNYGSAEAGSIDYVVGKKAILLTAPHAVYHERDGHEKKNDIRTGGLCRLLHQQADVSALIAAGYVPKWQSWQTRNDDFKALLLNAVVDGRFIIDMHGMTDNHGVDVCIGLGESPSRLALDVANCIQKKLHVYKVMINVPFSAKNPLTVTAYVQSIKGDDLQLEIAAHLREARTNTTNAAAFIRDLIDIINHLDRYTLKKL